LTVTVSNARFNLETPGVFSFQAPPLAFLGFVLGEGFNEHHCSQAEISCSYIMQFNAADMFFSVTPGGNIAAFSGSIMDTDDSFRRSS
jgi:hypothetical protein